MYTIKKNTPRKYVSCMSDNCNKYPSFGITKRLYCGKHKTNGMKNLTHSYCVFPGCNTISVFGITKKLYCKKHKMDDMKNLTKPRRTHIDRNTSTNFNVVHKLNNMIHHTKRNIAKHNIPSVIIPIIKHTPVLTKSNKNYRKTMEYSILDNIKPVFIHQLLLDQANIERLKL